MSTRNPIRYRVDFELAHLPVWKARTGGAGGDGVGMAARPHLVETGCVLILPIAAPAARRDTLQKEGRLCGRGTPPSAACIGGQ